MKPDWAKNMILSYDADIVEMLLEAGADPDAVASGGWTALSVACAGGHYRTVQYLLDADADPDEVDDSGRTLLHDAAEDGRWDIVRRDGGGELEMAGCIHLLVALTDHDSFAL